jgi:putative radical SAM enzyme (TIGR03279 family)
MAVTIKDVDRLSCAYKKGVRAGDTLMSINGNEIVDVLDYRFYQVNKKLELIISDKNGKTKKVKIKKQEYEELGLEFETYLMDKEHSCRNKCIFCFIDQLPKGMRDTLYFKDDDSRLSFLFGNYITLTNLTEHEISRIIKMHISPINVSVHTTNPELRCKMMNNRFAGQALDALRRFADAGLSINCQIVACPGINDGEELKRTLRDLEKMNVECVAVVPVGLTRYRDELYPLTPYTQQTASETLDIIEEFGNSFKEKYGRRIVYGADEFYIKAGRKIPDPDYYEGYPALENGVGLISLLKEEVELALEDRVGDTALNHTVSVACGECTHSHLVEILSKINTKYPEIKINVYKIKNNFFGGGIDVTGLVTGQDLIAQLKDKDLGSKLIVPSCMLRFEGDIFLDDVSLEDVEKELNINVKVSDNSGEMLVSEIIDKE